MSGRLGMRPPRPKFTSACAVVAGAIFLVAASSGASMTRAAPDPPAGSHARGAPVGNGVRTLVSSAQPITAFAQDGAWLAWMTLSHKHRCTSQLKIRSLRTRRSVSFPRTGGCAGAWGLAVGGDSALWMADAGYGNTEAWNSFRIASAHDPHARVLDHAFFSRDAGERPVPASAGAAGSLLYYTESCGDLGCERAVKRVLAGRSVTLFAPSTSGRTAALALNNDRIALLKSVFDSTAGSYRDLTWVELRSGNGSLLREFQVPGYPGGIALGGDFVAVLTASRPSQKRAIRLIDVQTGAVRALVPVSSGGNSLTASGRWVAFLTGKTIRLLDARTRLLSVVAKATATPLGLSISGRRLAWAEAYGRGSRIRGLILSPGGTPTIPGLSPQRFLP